MTLAGEDLVAFVGTNDPDRARSFYVDTLGLPVVSEDGFVLVVDAHGTTLRVTTAPDFAPLPFTVLGWAVAEIRGAMRDLGARGLVFARFDGMPQDEAGVWEAPGGALIAWFKDPDGNILSLTQAP